MTTHQQYGRLPASPPFWWALAVMAVLALAGVGAAWHMESNGHWLTAMSNSVPWGLSLALATFLIVAASGALNIASVASVFGKQDYAPMGRLSCVTALALLSGGLLTLLLDLGRPEKIFTALTHFNFTSVFAINIIIYTVFFVLVLSYVGIMCLPALASLYKSMGCAAFIWRLIMTTGTGSVFGVLTARSAYHSALMPPLFIALSLSVGLGVFILVLDGLEVLHGRALASDTLRQKLRSLLPTLVAVTLYMVLALQVINLATPAMRPFEDFVLCSGGVFPVLLWGGFGVVGTLIPLCCTLWPSAKNSPCCLRLAATGAVLGGAALVYVLTLAPQMFPMDIFPGKIVHTAFYAQVSAYSPMWAEWALGLGGVGIAGLLLLLVARLLPLIPRNR